MRDKRFAAIGSLHVIGFVAVLASLSACSGSSNDTAASPTSNAKALSVDAASPSVQTSPPASTAAAFGGVTLPAGHELLALRQNCQICHSLDMVYTQRLSKPTWNAEVTKMIKFGAPLKAGEKAAVIAYLAKYLGPTVPRSNDRSTAIAPVITYSAAPPQQ